MGKTVERPFTQSYKGLNRKDGSQLHLFVREVIRDDFLFFRLNIMQSIMHLLPNRVITTAGTDMESQQMEFRDALKLFRSEVGIAQTDIAVALHVNITTVAPWELGKTIEYG